MPRVESLSLRDLSLMVKYETFNLCYMGSSPIGLIVMNI